MFFRKMFTAIWLVISLCLFGDWMCVQGRRPLTTYIQEKSPSFVDQYGRAHYSLPCQTHVPDPQDVPDPNKKGPFRPIFFQVGEVVVTDDCFSCKCMESAMKCQIFGINALSDLVAPEGYHYVVRGCTDFSLVKNSTHSDPCFPRPRC